MVVDVNDLNGSVAGVDKNRPVVAGDAKAPDAEVPRLQEFGVQARVERILLKEPLLLLESPRKISLLHVGG